MNPSADDVTHLALVQRNRWTDHPLVEGPVDRWARLRVAVVVPAFNAGRTLPLTLASLEHQTYPRHLIDVVVGDDGSEPPMTDIVGSESGVRVLVARPDRWGPSNARQVGADAVDADILMFIDSDMVLFHDHVESQMRIHHSIDDAVVIGHKLFVADWEHVDAEAVRAATAAGEVADLFPAQEATEHWIHEVILSTGQLSDADHTAFRVFTGATGSMPKRLYDEAGGMDFALHTGQDTEIGYRLAQAGGVMIPALDSSAWHLGATNMDRNGDAVRAWNLPFIAHRVPLFQYMREDRAVAWKVPLVECVVDATAAEEAVVRRCVEALLSSETRDLRVHLVGPWSSLHDPRRQVRSDPDAPLYALRAWFGHDQRVVLAEQAPTDAFPAPFLLEIPPQATVGPTSLAALVKTANRHQVGRVNVLVAGLDKDDPVRLTRTAAWRRAARRDREHPIPTDDDLHAAWGLRWADGGELGISAPPSA